MLTAILTTYRRPQTFAAQLAAVRAQSVSPNAIWAWANEPTAEIASLLVAARLDRVVTCGDNAKFHGRFALALLARTEYVAIFDDDSLPGPKWFENCLKTMSQTPGILGTAGVVLDGPGYAGRVMHGWQRPSDDTTEVDLVCQAWFLRSEWLKYLFFSPATLGTNGEDIELSARAWRHAGIRSFCPPHPAGDQSLWGSTRGMELGTDKVSASFRVGHLGERETIVAAELAAGWLPLFAREEVGSTQPVAVVGGRQQAVGSGRQAPATQQDDLAYSSLATRHTPHATHPKLSECFPLSGWDTVYEYAFDDRGKPTGESSSVLRAAAWPVQGAGKNLPAHPADDSSPFIEENGESRMVYDRMELGLSLNYMRDPLTFLRHARKQLAPGGTVTASFLEAQHPSVVNEILAGQPPYSSHLSPPLRIFTEREIEKLLYRAGFEQGSGGGIQGSGKTLEPPIIRSISFTPRVSSPTPDPRIPTPALTSIVIVTYNGLAYTRGCLESIRFLTDEPYELIVVDNGSTDGTVDFLRGAANVRLITNPDNRGFPAAANQGIQAARGETILLLNNDVLVTTGWLGRMLAALETGSGGEAAYDVVGPCSNNVSGPQQIEVSYDDLAQLDGFAWEWAKAHAGQREKTDRLVGFCLLARREVFERVGLLDERFGIGNFEDDDFCLRAVAAGYRLAIARDSFIHHFGHRSFLAAGVDLRSLLASNRRLFDEKWRSVGQAFKPDGDPLAGSGVPCREVDKAFQPYGRQSDAWRRRDVVQPFEPDARQLDASAASSSAVGQAFQPDGDPFDVSLAERRDACQAGKPDLRTGTPTIDARQAGKPDLRTGTPTIDARQAGKPGLRPLLSLTMIVRDNASTIRACLESIRPWVDEMIVVDTGSADETRAICRELGAEVHHFPWPDSFAVARNESLRHARGQWILWIDSDDVIDADNGRKLRALVNRQHEPNLLGYVMQVHCPGSGLDGAHDVTVVDHLKLFRNRPDLRFEGRIHEQMLEAINRAGGDVAFTDIFVVHAGADHSPDGRRRKLARDVRLLQFDRRERPNHPFVHFNLGMTYADAGKHRAAVRALRRSLRLSRPHESHVRKIYALLVASHRELGQSAEARQACAEGLKLYPKDPELLFRHAMLAHDDGQLREAEAAYRAALANDDRTHFASIDRGIVGFKARQNLAAVYTDLGEPRLAEAEWRLIVAEVPGYRDGWRGLVENLIVQGKLDEGGELAERLMEQPRLRGLAYTLAGRVAEASGKGGDAEAIWRRGARECPTDAAPLRELCRWLFHTGEPAEAQALLEELARREPADGSAHHNLGTLLLRRGDAARAAAAFQESLRRRPASPVTLLSLGYALRDTGDLPAAANALHRCLKLAPAEPIAGEAARQLQSLVA